MKKITLIILLTTAFGFSQSLPFTFEESADPKYYFKECFDCDFQITTDPDNASNKVGQLTSYDFAEFGNAQTIDLAQYVDLSDPNNNTITFRIKPLNGTGSGNHMVKFSGGSTPFGVEVKFTTTGTDWQNITLDFGSDPKLGTYRNMIFFPDFFEKATEVYLIDDIEGGVNVAPRDRPNQSAPIPTIPANKVKSVYGETYTNLTYLYNFSESFREVDIENNGNKALEVDLGYYGAAFQNTDVSNDMYVHFDYWTTDATKFALRVNSENPAQFEAQYILGAGGSEPIVKDTWTSVFIPLGYYDNLGVNLMDVFQYNFVDAGGTGTVFIDNIYFTSESSLGLSDVKASAIKVSPNPSESFWDIKMDNQIISSVQVYDVLGKKVMAHKSNGTSITIDGSRLKSGLYFAEIQTQKGGTSTVRLFRK